jgi:30S ribosomal protein S31
VVDSRPFALGATGLFRTTFEEHVQEQEMGKGDRKTVKGKRYNASYGNARPKAVAKAAGAEKAPVVKKAAAKTVAKAPARKVAVKKAASKE